MRGVTVTVPLPEVKPVAEAVMVADPMPTPVTVAEPLIAPAAMLMLAGAGTFVASLVVKFMVTPPAGAGDDSVTGKLVDKLSPTEGLPKAIPPGTVTVAVALATKFELAAVIVAEPPAALAGTLTCTVAVVAPALKLTVAGTVARFVLFELRFTVKPAGGACPPVRVSVRVP